MKCWTGEAGWVSVSTVIFYHPYPSWDEAQAMTRHPLWLDRNPNVESLVWSGEGLKEVEMVRAFATAVVICLLSNWSLCLVCANRNCVICYQSATCKKGKCEEKQKKKKLRRNWRKSWSLRKTGKIGGMEHERKGVKEVEDDEVGVHRYRNWSERDRGEKVEVIK